MSKEGLRPQLQMPDSPYRPRPYRGPSREEVWTERQRYINPGIFHFYKEPIMLVEGRGQYLFDEQGKRYLDLFAGIATVSCGHAHPLVIARIQKQLDHLQHASTIYLHPSFGELARRLAELLPEGLEVVYFTNSGSEANELAINMARLYTGCTDVIAVRNGYHGGSAAAMGLTGLSTWKFPIPQGVGIRHTVCPDPYRSPFEGTPEEIAAGSARDVDEIIRFQTPGKVAAFIYEAIQGVGGVTTAAPNYLPMVYELIRLAGGLCIADEVQCGFARTGGHFWGFEEFGVVPDIVTLAKAIGNGMPLGAVVTRREIAEVLSWRLHFNTFGGNPVAMAAGLGVLDAIQTDRLQENARRIGAHLKQRLEELMANQPLIGDVRGQGLMLGVELVLDRETREPATQQTLQVMEGCRRHGVLIGRGGYFGNVLRIKPPLCLTEADADFAVEVLGEVLSKPEPEGGGA